MLSNLLTNVASHQITNSASERLCSVSRSRQLISAARYHKWASRCSLTRWYNFFDFPLFTMNGKWYHQSEAWTNWCEGFLGGMLWIFARRTGDAWWRDRAEHYSRLIEHRKHDTSVHDMGFLFWSTYKRWYDLTGDSAVNDVVIQAGRTEALRFNEKGRYLRSFVAPESCFIDIMMNVGVVFYAAQQTDD